MRIKIIAVNALIVIIVGLLSFGLVKSALSSATSNKDQLSADAERDVQGAAARLQLDGLRAERWLAGKASEAATVDTLRKATQSARGESATKRCDDLQSTMKNTSLFDGNVPTLVALLDADGKIVGRNGSSLNRGDDLASANAGVKSTITTGQSGSDVWAATSTLASYVAIHDDQGKIIGALVIGRSLSDTLSRVSEATTGRPLLVVVPKGDDFPVVAHSALTAAGLEDSIAHGAKDTLKNALAHGTATAVIDHDMIVAASPLPGFEDGKRALLIASAPATLIQDASSVALPILGALALGLVLVVIGGWLLGNYITGPINQLEEGLLAILNGQSDKRFELEHAELGGLAFRIDQLLNQLMGVEEDTTDAEGRVSRAPDASNFNDAMAVDDKRMQAAENSLDPDAIARLAAEPDAAYYARIYREYIGAKKALGEQTDHITEQAFATRIQGMEQEAAQKHGRRVRYQVAARNKEVVLLAVPLP